MIFLLKKERKKLAIIFWVILCLAQSMTTWVISLVNGLLQALNRSLISFLEGSTTSSNKVSLQISLERNSSNFSDISFLSVNYENLTVEFHVPYILNMHIKCHLNRILFTTRSINLCFIHNFISQKLENFTFVWWHSNWSLIFLKFCKHERHNKNM